MAFGSLPRHVLPLTSTDLSKNNNSRPFYQLPPTQTLANVAKSRQTRRILAVLVVLFVFWKAQPLVFLSCPFPALKQRLPKLTCW